MSDIRDEFAALAKDLYDEFDIGKDPGELVVLSTLQRYDPVTGDPTPPTVTRTVRCVRRDISAYQDTAHAERADVAVMILCDEIRGYVPDTSTRMAIGTDKYSVVRVKRSPKDIIITLYGRSI